MAFKVEKKIDGQWFPEGTYRNPEKLALGMWQAGLMRPEWEDIRVTSDFVEISNVDPMVSYLMHMTGVTKEVAQEVLEISRGSVIHAHAAIMCALGVRDRVTW